MYDIIFISYNEKTADANFSNLKRRFPLAKRVQGIKGIHQAHIAAAKKAMSKLFWVVDADAIILDTFNFDHQVEEWDVDCVHVWRSRNPVNDLEYGYGGVKLLPRKLTIEMDVSKTDMTTSISDQFKLMSDISNLTVFNIDPFSSWRSAFRECVKLSSKTIDRQNDTETEHRLETWCTVGTSKPYGSFAIAGAQAGKEYGITNVGNDEMLSKINDWEWLKNEYCKYGFSEDTVE
jgi:hypothetical protein